MSQPLPTYPSSQQQPGAFCAVHVERAAATICNRCGNYACESCFEVGADRQDYCVNCLPRAEPELATRGSRLGAALVDGFGVVLPPILLGAVAHAVTREFWAALLFGGAGLIAMFCLQIYLLVTYGQTIGKRSRGIKVVRTDGSNVGLGRLFLLRNLVPGLINTPTSGLFNLIDALVIFAEPRRCLHDYIADTKVIQVGPKAPRLED